jgi:nitronate monooxygenase
MRARITESFLSQLRLPAIGSPMFLVSNPALVIAQCKAGIVGAFPALGARSSDILDEWLSLITKELSSHNQEATNRQAAPFAVNLVIHKTNVRLDADIALCAKHRVPIVITSLGARQEVFDTLRAFDAMILHDVTNNGFARKAYERGVDGLVAVAAGAGGHAGNISPFALVREIRAWYDGLLVLSGSIAHGASILAAQALGADLAYIGSAFIATQESNATHLYKEMVVRSAADDIVYTDFFTGVRGNYLKPSIVASGLDPDNLGYSDPSRMNFATERPKTWRDVWGCGQGIGIINEILSTSDFVGRLENEYRAALMRLGEGGVRGRV